MEDKKPAPEAVPQSEPVSGGLPVSESDILEAFAGPALAINRMIAINSYGGMRLSFLETNPRVSPQFRTAVFLSYADAASLAVLINSQLRLAEGLLSTQLPVPAAPPKAEET